METYELQKIYSRNIYLARTNLGYSQMKLAELADISTGFLCDIERGLKAGTFETIAKLAAALKKEPYELFIPENTKIELAIYSKIKNDVATKFYKALKTNVEKSIDTTMDDFLEN